MFERFTELARQTVVCAQDEARLLRHDHIGGEHLLLGLLRVEQGLGARALVSLGVSLEGLRGLLVAAVGLGEEQIAGQIPFTPRSKKMLELALREALSLGHNYVGTEHVLLGVVREAEGPAAELLQIMQVTPEAVRETVVRMLSGRAPNQEADVDLRQLQSEARIAASASSRFANSLKRFIDQQD